MASARSLVRSEKRKRTERFDYSRNHSPPVHAGGFLLRTSNERFQNDRRSREARGPSLGGPRARRQPQGRNVTCTFRACRELTAMEPRRFMQAGFCCDATKLSRGGRSTRVPAILISSRLGEQRQDTVGDVDSNDV